VIASSTTDTPTATATATATETQNPNSKYYSGCLYHYYSQQYQQLQQQGTDDVRSLLSRYRRVCNSNDPPDRRYQINNATQHQQPGQEFLTCRQPEFDYLEIRIATGNWDSATMLGWLTQIILSELLGVPTTIESGSRESESSRDLYDLFGRIGTFYQQK
jgi:hypothetical protein